MSRRAVVAIAALVVLVVAGIVFQEDQRQLTATSYGTVAGGHRALFELLRGLGLPVERSFEPPGLLEPATVWWVEPWQLCTGEAQQETGSGGESAGEEAEAGEGAKERTRDRHARPGSADSGLADFVRRGGRAVVFLRVRQALYAPHPADPCASLAGRALPALRDPAEEPAPDETPSEETGSGARAAIAPGPARRAAAAARFVVASAPDPTPAPLAPREPVAQRVAGELTTRARTLVVPPLARFAEPGDWEPALLLEGEPFGLAASLGRGRILVVADGTFLRNAWIDGGDSALLALDLVRALGVPRVDEHAHGLRLEQSRTVLLVQLGALPVFVSVAALAVLFGWWLAAVPVGIPATVPSVRPALDEFVSSLASLYAVNRDYAGLAERYRELTVERLRSHLGLAPETPAGLLVERLRSRRRVSREQLALLERSAPPVRSRSEWLERVQALDALLEEVCR